MTDPTRTRRWRTVAGAVLRDTSKTIEAGMVDALEAAFLEGQDSVAGPRDVPRPRDVTIRDDRGGVTKPAPIAPAAVQSELGGVAPAKGGGDGRR